MANLDFISHQVIADVNGNPLPGAKVFYYLTGTTTLQNTYSDAGLTAANTNPVIADANGVVGSVFLTATRYKRTVKTSADVSLPQYDVDPLDASLELITLAALPSPAYPFLRVANTADGHTYRRNLANSAWIDEGLTDSLLNAATVTDQLTGTSAALASTPDSVAALWQRGTDIASAATLSLPATGGGVFNITGTTGVTAISSAQGGRTIKLRFAGALTITHNATSMILPGAANITTVAGDMAEFVNEGAADATSSNWRCFNYQRASGSSINITDQLATQANMEAASSTTTYVSPGRTQYHPGVAKGWVNFTIAAATTASHNVTSITDTGVAKWAIVWATDFSSANYCCVTGSEATANNETAVDTLSAGGVNVKMYRSDDTNTAETSSTASHVAAFGDQA